MGEAIKDQGEYGLMQVETELVWACHQLGQSQIDLAIWTFELYQQHCLCIVIRIGWCWLRRGQMFVALGVNHAS